MPPLFGARRNASPRSSFNLLLGFAAEFVGGHSLKNRDVQTGKRLHIGTYVQFCCRGCIDEAYMLRKNAADSLAKVTFFDFGKHALKRVMPLAGFAR